MISTCLGDALPRAFLASTTPEPESLAQTGGIAGEETTGGGRGRGRGTSSQASGRAAGEEAKKKVRDLTIHLADDLFERSLAQADRRDEIISDDVAAILERQVPDHRVIWGVESGSEAGAA